MGGSKERGAAKKSRGRKVKETPLSPAAAPRRRGLFVRTRRSEESEGERRAAWADDRARLCLCLALRRPASSESAPA